MTPKYSIRKATPEDYPFIYSSWLKSYRNSDFATTQANHVYHLNQHNIIEEILNTCEVYLITSAPSPEQEILFGFIAYEYLQNVPVIHYLYIKYTYRGFGLGKALFNLAVNTLPDGSKEPFLYTYHSFDAKQLRVKFNACIYNPYIAIVKIWKRFTND